MSSVAAAIVLASVLPGMATSAIPAASPAGPTPAETSHTADALPTAVQAGDALASAVTIDQAEAALRTILTGGGIAVDDGTGAPAAQAKATIPAWEVITLANAQISGISITVAENAELFDMVSRWAGGASISPAKFSEFLSRWTADPADDAEGYVLNALGELGKQTLPAYDIAKGADADAPLPLLMVIQEQIALSALDVDSPAAAQPQGLLLRSETGTMCDTIATSKSIAKFSSKAWDWLIQKGENWGNIGARAEELGAAAAEAEGGAGAAAEAGSGIGTVIFIAAGMIQNAMAQGYVDVDLAQDPRPVAKHEQGAQPNQTVLTVTLKGDKDIPKDFASCMKLLGGLGVTLGQPGQPVAKATVTVTAGANFPRHLTWASGSPPGDRTTDADGQITVPLLTKPQPLPQGQGTVKTREAMVHVVASLQHLRISPSAIVAKAMEKIAPWSNDYAIEVTQREKPALSIKGSFDMNAVILEVHGTLDLHSCDGFEGGWSGTLDLGGGFANGADQAATALTGLPATGQGTFALGGLIALQPKAVPDDPAKPKLGVTNTLGGKIAIKFLDEDTAELILNGTPALNLATGQVAQFFVTQGSDKCPS